ncbi:MAG: OmpA family protein [Candidatus Omnitrophica bacterium]|nr:OmpA family protein [Candidatus Omnitrophota bacterium]
MFNKFKYLITIPLLIGLCGCSIILQKRNPNDLDKIDSLSDSLEKEKSAREELLRAKNELEEQLKKEIEEKQIRIQMLNKGLVITFVDEILFDSGKAKIRKEAYSVLDRVADVLNGQVRDRDIAIEGHTDNQPIKKSPWASNWDLSTARAISVLHYMIDNKNVEPQRLSAVGYGEFRPVASNDTVSGRQQNRRVEITILPDKILKKKSGEEISIPDSELK